MGVAYFGKYSLATVASARHSWGVMPLGEREGGAVLPLGTQQHREQPIEIGVCYILVHSVERQRHIW